MKKAIRPPRWSKQYRALCLGREDHSSPVRADEFMEIAAIKLNVVDPDDPDSVVRNVSVGELARGTAHWFPPPLEPDDPVRRGCGHRLLFRHWACVCGTTLADALPAWGIAVLRFTDEQRHDLALPHEICDQIERIVNRHRVDFRTYRPRGASPTQREAVALRRLVSDLKEVHRRPWARRLFIGGDLFDETFQSVIGTINLACREADRRGKGPRPNIAARLLKLWVLNCLEWQMPGGPRTEREPHWQPPMSDKVLYATFGAVMEMTTGVRMADPKKECQKIRQWDEDRMKGARP